MWKLKIERVYDYINLVFDDIHEMTEYLEKTQKHGTEEFVYKIEYIEKKGEQNNESGDSSNDSME